MAGVDNLDPIKDTETAKQRGKQGGIASGIAKRQKKTMREMMLRFLDKTDEKEFQQAMLTLLKNGDSTTNKLIDQLTAVHGDSEAKEDGIKLLKELLK